MDQHSFRFDWLVFLNKARQRKSPAVRGFFVGAPPHGGSPVNLNLQAPRLSGGACGSS
jgi:hypothetical protein